MRSITAEDIERYREFSLRTFGPADPEVNNEGVIDHIQKELTEVWENPEDLYEWIDIVILAIDGAYRNGHSPQDIIDAYHAKCEKNYGREWPDWRLMDRRRAIEHVRTEEKPAVTREEFIALLKRPKKEVCPTCDGDLMGPTCHFTYSTWRCWGCGATLDSRVVTPKVVYLDEQ